MADNMDYAPIGGLNQTGLLEHLSNVISEHFVSADNVGYQNADSSEVRNPPEGGVTGDTSGRFHIEAPWTCEDCPQNLTVNMNHPRAKRMFNKHMIEFTTHQGEFITISTLPERCRDCDTRYRKHKRTSKAIRAVFYHPNRMYKPEDENVWCFVPTKKGRQYRHIKLITLEHPTHSILLKSQTPSTATEEDRRLSSDHVARAEVDVGRGAGGALENMALSAGAEIKEKFRRARKKEFWSSNVLYGRWFFEVTWTVHYQDGSKSRATQWMPGDKELEGAESVSIHPHLHVIACSKFMDKEELTDWWDYGTHIRATDRWMVCKDYLTKYVNKQQLAGRHQGTFGSVKKK